MDRYSAEWEHSLLNMSDLIYTVGEEKLARVKDLYSDESRYFHNWSHALDVLKAVLQLGLPDVPRRAHALAAIFHDVVYVVGDKRNEENSVTLMMEWVRNREQESVMAAADLIMATKRHMISTVENVAPPHRDFLDCDLLHLSNDCWPIVVQYDYAEGAERLAAGWDLNSVLDGRKTFFQNMLTKPTIYLGNYYGPSNEWRARLNVRKLLEHRHDYAPLLEKLRSKRETKRSGRRKALSEHPTGDPQS